MDEKAIPLANYSYTAFGECSQSGSFHSPWQYSAQRIDPKTNLIHFQKRVYDPHTGRWLTPDPLGFADGPNLYAYLHNNPLIHIDLEGFFTRALWNHSRSFLDGINTGLSRGILEPENASNHLVNSNMHLDESSWKSNFTEFAQRWKIQSTADACRFFGERLGEATGVGVHAGLLICGAGELILPALRTTGAAYTAAVGYFARNQVCKTAGRALFINTAKNSTSVIGQGSTSINARKALVNKLKNLEEFQQTAIRTRTLSDARIRYYKAERPAKKFGDTRGASMVTEFNPLTGTSRSWNECYDHLGKINRVHPKSINGQEVNCKHYPPIASELNCDF